MGLGNMEQRTEGIRKQAGELIEQAYQRGFKAGQENAWEMDVKKYIEKGRDEAWEVAKWIAGDCLSESRMTKELFDFNYAYPVFKNFSASEAIKKIRAYEEQERQKQDEIKVGDEVIYHDDKGVVVLAANNGKTISIMSANGGWMIRANSEDLVKTGRTFPEIAEVLKKMQEGE